MSGCAPLELGALAGVDALACALQTQEPVVYTASGNRAREGTAFLTEIKRGMHRWGVTRLAEISELAPGAFPVFQTTRPQLHAHPNAGQNSGSQGKGRDRVQAQISAIMEELESFCAEPKSALLVRSSYAQLKRSHLVVPPRRFTHNEDTARASAQTPLMWFEGFSLDARAAVMIPAESVFFPFAPEIYATESFFPCSTNGLAAGATYLEAVIHALYEVIERAYKACYELGDAQIHRLDHEAWLPAAEPTLARAADEGALELLSVELDGCETNLPMIVAHLHTMGRTYGGYGCSANVNISVERALSEAMQAYAVDISGSREDLEAKGERAFRTEKKSPHLAVTLEAYRERVFDRQFDTLGDELDALRSWLRGFGFPSVLVANLTRVGIDRPVVKVVVPGMPCPVALREATRRPATISQTMRDRYALPANPSVGPVEAGELVDTVKVYAGLSIDEQQVRAVLPDALVVGPVERGDVLRDIAAGHRTIAIIDGRFQQALAVSPGELMDALRCGVRLYGSSSMGALRAAELWRYGMIGHGAVFEHICNAESFRDDYLGQLFYDEPLKSNSVPYVNVHLALDALLKSGRIDERAQSVVAELYRELHFSERDPRNLERSIQQHYDGDPALLRAAELAVEQGDAKRRDALGLVQRIATDATDRAHNQRAIIEALRELRRFDALQPALDLSFRV